MAGPQSRLLRRDSTARSSISSQASALSLPASRYRDVARYVGFTSAIFSCLCAGSITAFSLYGHLFQERLRYTQLQVNSVMIAAELGMYLTVPLFGYLCDRIGPAPLSFISALLYGFAYLLAAFTYKRGARGVDGFARSDGWPIWVMIMAFTVIGVATTCMYISSVTTCAKNFGRGKYRGIALASPIAAFGLSGMLVSQVGEKALYERIPNGQRGDVDVFKFFLFLAIILVVAGFLGSLMLKIVDEEGLIHEAVEELERSGLLEDRAFFRGAGNYRNYGAVNHDNASAEGRRAYAPRSNSEEEVLKKTWLLNEETKRFVKDKTMWSLALSFFFMAGPGEAFLTNIGTIIGTLYPAGLAPATIPTSAATQVSIIALTSTLSRLLFGTLTDLLAPTVTGHHYQSAANSISSLPLSSDGKIRFSRITFLIGSALLLSIGQVLLASGVAQNHAERLWIVTAFIGIGYGAIFSLTPLIISVIWGVENFGTNWGIVAMMPALGATLWGFIYSAVYQWGAKHPTAIAVVEDLLCHGKQCYGSSFWAMACSVWLSCGLLLWAWKGRDGWSQRGIAV